MYFQGMCISVVHYAWLEKTGYPILVFEYRQTIAALSVSFANPSSSADLKSLSTLDLQSV